MMRGNILLWSVVSVAATLLFASCVKEFEDGTGTGFVEGELVDVTIDLGVGQLTAMTGTAETRSFDLTVGDTPEDIVCEAVRPAEQEPDTKYGINDTTLASSAIKNLWVLQYDGVGDDAKLLTSRYIEDYSVAANRTVKLIGSTSPNTIAFLANTYRNDLSFTVNKSISVLKGFKFITKSLDRIVTYDPNTVVQGGADFPDNRDYYQRLNGFDTTVVTTGCVLGGELQHNLCRISVNVTNNTQGTTYPVTLTSADIENVPGCVYFVTDYAGYTSGTAVGKPTNDELTSVSYGLYDYTEVIKWSSSEGTAGTKSAKLYLPANESGVISSNTNNPKLKSLFAPSRATMLRIHGTYKDSLSQDIPVTYSFALGENMTNNYQLVPNGDYVYNITLNARGDKTTDGRVSYGSANGIDYTDTSTWPLANCYICNPPATGTATYKIPVLRVDQFWGDNNYENVPNNCIGSTGTWTVSVIWSDMEVNASNFIISKDSGTGVGTYGNFEYFEVQIPSTTVKGNVIIGIKNSNSSDWLWSWHLWVTDYCPDDAVYLSQQGAFISGTDTYYTTGGKVHRYTKGATYVYMDRCIGALDSDATGYARGTMYYQFGRKDPFPGNSPEYYLGGTTKQTYTINTIAYNNTGATQPQNVPYSIAHPNTFITKDYTYWTYGDKYNPESGDNKIIWSDPNASSNGNKSIFDPSPSGWKVPTTYTGLSYYSSSGGICYANTGEGGKGTVGLPAHGYRHQKQGALQDGDRFGSYWTSYQSGPNYSAYLYAASTYFSGFYIASNVSNIPRAAGVPIIPVQE